MSAADERPVLVTGGAGFIGSNLADRLARDGHRVIVYDACVRPGVERNLAWLIARHGDRIEPHVADVRNRGALEDAVTRAKAVFHFAAQVAVTTSLDDPRHDFAVNVAATFDLLEAARACSTPPPVIFASTNKVYGDLADLAMVDNRGHRPADPAYAHGIDTRRPLDFHTPYGCSKGAADQYVLDYARSYGLPAAVLRMSCIYGERQMGTEDQGWVAHFLIRAIEGRQITLYGDGRQVRDIMDVGDAIEAYLALWSRIDRLKGRAFNLGGGPDNAVSLHAVLAEIERLTGRAIDVRHEDWRAGDQRWFVADTRETCLELGLAKPMGWRHGLHGLHAWLVAERAAPPPMLEIVRV